jgi:DNA (cytosine-5)-methyltransferase 1
MLGGENQTFEGPETEGSELLSHPVITTDTTMVLPSEALIKLREYFTRISFRERDLGIPVGAFIFPKHAAGKIKQKWPLTNHSEWGRIGLSKVREVPGDPNYLVVHLSTNTAKLFAFSRELLGHDFEEFLTTSGAEYYPGIRINDPIFDLPPVGNRSLEPSRFKFAELFAGIGGFRLGLESIGGKCVFASEIDASARETYALNFGSSGELYGDITEFYGNDLPEFDLLTGGFPCQSFSVRGEQKGLEDPRGQLYRELLRILTVCQPKSFLFENVAHLVTMDGGKRNQRENPMDELRVGQTFQMMLTSFEETGYHVTWNIINSRHWLPQQRERVYIVGFRKDLGITEIDWKLGRPYWSGSHGRIINDQTTPGLLSCVRDILEDPSSPAIQQASLTLTQWERMNKPENLEKANKWQNASVRGGRNRTIPLDGKSPTITSGYRNVSSFSTRFIFEEKDGQIREIPRFLTERECARLMGLPDSFHFLTTKGYRSYHQIGNAVCPPVARVIGEEIMKALNL